MLIKLYNYFCSLVLFCVCIVLEVKGLLYDYVLVYLFKGEQMVFDFVKLNFDVLVFVLCDGNDVLNQFLVIVEYFEEMYFELMLFLGLFSNCVYICVIVLVIVCEIYLFNNLCVFKYLKNMFNVEEEVCNDWYCYWVKLGFVVLEMWLLQLLLMGVYCVGDMLMLVDVCLVLQVFNGKWFDVVVEDYLMFVCIFEYCMVQEVFQRVVFVVQLDVVFV